MHIDNLKNYCHVEQALSNHELFMPEIKLIISAHKYVLKVNKITLLD